MGRWRKAEPNLYAPELYADTLELRIALVDLPGSAEAGSTWDISYSLYFIPETEYWEAVNKSIRTGEQIAEPSQFPRKLLLNEGALKKKRLRDVFERTIRLKDIRFKAKVPQKLRTKFAYLLMAFSTKIFDGRLKTGIYRSSVFLMEPFVDDPEHDNRAIARRIVYTNFFVTPKGDLYTSQWPRSLDDTRWHR